MSVRAKLFAGVIVEHEGKILLVRDAGGSFPGFDFPGGKVLWSEEVKDCSVREFKEETGYEVSLESLLGIYQRKTNEDEDDYIRFIFIGKLKNKAPSKMIDPNKSIWGMGFNVKRPANLAVGSPSSSATLPRH